MREEVKAKKGAQGYTSVKYLGKANKPAYAYHLVTSGPKFFQTVKALQNQLSYENSRINN